MKSRCDPSKQASWHLFLTTVYDVILKMIRDLSDGFRIGVCVFGRLACLLHTSVADRSSDYPQEDEGMMRHLLVQTGSVYDPNRLFRSAGRIGGD